MKFFEYMLKNTLLIHYITLIIVVVGILSIGNMQREARPNVNFNRVNIFAVYPGASPSDVEELIIDPIEDKISEVDGIEEYRSVSFQGAGSISVKIDDEYPDVDSVIDDIRRKVSEVRDLPSEVENPVVSEVKAINIPILGMALYGDLSPLKMKMEVEKLKDFLKNVPGVQSVSYIGLEDLQLKILAKPEKLNAYDVTLLELMSGLRSWSKERPGGLLENTESTSSLSVGSTYDSIEKIKKFVVRSNDSSQSVKLENLADISFDTEKSQIKNLYGDKNAVLITIVKKPFSDIIDTVDLVKSELEKYKPNFAEGLEYKLYNDQAIRVRNRLDIVTQNALFGLILVLFLLIIFLDLRSAIVTAIGIPVAVLGGIVLIYLLGYTMNSLVLVGMIIVLGMLVDDAIVVCENIYGYVEKGMAPMKAALKGVTEIATPVIATVLTTIFAFFPIAFMEGVMGQFLGVIPITVIAMLVVSLFESLIILPVHAGEIMKPAKKRKSLFLKLEQKYEKYLRWSLRFRWIIALVAVIFFALSFIQGRAIFEKFSLFPASGLEGFSVRVELEKNTPIIKSTEKIKKLSAAINENHADDFDTFYSTVGQVRTGGSSGSRQTATHLGQINITFTSDPEFIYREKKVLKAIQKTIKEFEKKENVKTSMTIDRPGPPVGKPIQFELASRDLEVGSKIARKIIDSLTKIEGVHSAETDLDGDSLKYRFIINNTAAVSEGITPQDISATLFSASTGVVTNEILKNNEKVELLIGVAGTLIIKDLLNVKIRNKVGQAVPLRNFVKAVEEFGPSSIQRFDGMRTITVFAEVDDNVITGKEANKKIGPVVAQLKKDYPNVKIKTGGGAKQRMDALADTMKLYILALLMIFIIISLLFGSILYPFLVLITIPMGLCGVVWSLLLHGQPFSLMGIIGVVGLSGVVVNISIILMKFLQDRLKEGIEFKEAIIDSGVRRLRPIVITTITTLIGLMPTIYGVGGVDSFVQPLALVLGWGLFVATFLSLSVLPAIISFFPMLDWDRWRSK